MINKAQIIEKNYKQIYQPTSNIPDFSRLALIVDLRDQYNKTYKEISQFLNLSQPRVRQLYDKAKKFLDDDLVLKTIEYKTRDKSEVTTPQERLLRKIHNYETSFISDFISQWNNFKKSLQRYETGRLEYREYKPCSIPVDNLLKAMGISIKSCACCIEDLLLKNKSKGCTVRVANGLKNLDYQMRTVSELLAKDSSVIFNIRNFGYYSFLYLVDVLINHQCVAP